ncbi:hypothetical protein DL96DRAFT_1638335 [Flagelloscypha sp. PMI_526]|nr:hypothetical protein DL96DRAFT_1638335 [Flagelloscypha sp. PMI_526]
MAIAVLPSELWHVILAYFSPKAQWRIQTVNKAMHQIVQNQKRAFLDVSPHDHPSSLGWNLGDLEVRLNQARAEPDGIRHVRLANNIVITQVLGPLHSMDDCTDLQLRILDDSIILQDLPIFTSVHKLSITNHSLKKTDQAPSVLLAWNMWALQLTCLSLHAHTSEALSTILPQNLDGALLLPALRTFRLRTWQIQPQEYSERVHLLLSKAPLLEDIEFHLTTKVADATQGWRPSNLALPFPTIRRFKLTTTLAASTVPYTTSTPGLPPFFARLSSSLRVLYLDPLPLSKVLLPVMNFDLLIEVRIRFPNWHYLDPEDNIFRKLGESVSLEILEIVSLKPPVRSYAFLFQPMSHLQHLYIPIDAFRFAPEDLQAMARACPNLHKLLVDLREPDALPWEDPSFAKLVHRQDKLVQRFRMSPKSILHSLKHWNLVDFGIVWIGMALTDLEPLIQTILEMVSSIRSLYGMGRLYIPADNTMDMAWTGELRSSYEEKAVSKI